MALMDCARSWRESTSVPSRSKISSLSRAAGMGRLVLITPPFYLPDFRCLRNAAGFTIEKLMATKTEPRPAAVKAPEPAASGEKTYQGLTKKQLIEFYRLMFLSRR